MMFTAVDEEHNSGGIMGGLKGILYSKQKKLGIS